LYLDELLAALWERGREPRLLVVVSVHGAEDDYGPRKAWRVLSRAPAQRGTFDRAPAGVLMALGEGIRSEPRVGTAQLVDLVPTLLYGLGFPVARDLDGAVLTEAFDTGFLARQPLTFLPSYETFAAPEEE
jgi:arylsulfatase A-like enzyme